MELDQYARTCDPGKNPGTEGEELAYWRKYGALQGWMQNLWRTKGGTGEFNCEQVELTVADLDQLQRAVNLREMHHVDGFFFGAAIFADGTDKRAYDRALVLEFIDKALDAIESGKRIFNWSWY